MSKLWTWLNGKKTTIAVVLSVIVSILGRRGVAIPEEVFWITDGLLGLGLAHKALKVAGGPKAVAAAVLALVAAGCTTSGASDQLAGQAPVRGTAAAWNSVATTEDRGTLRDTLGLASEGVEVPLFSKAGEPLLDRNGAPIVVRIGRGLRDVNIFMGEVSIAAETTVSGSSAGNTLPSTQAPTGPVVSPPINVSGLPK